VSSHQQPRAAWDIGSRGAAVVAAFAVVVAVVAAVLAWRSRPDVTPLAAGPTGIELTATGRAEIVVAVSGKVRNPGLVRLPAGARVADAIAAAGGVLPGTDTASLNLARKVSDGELIAVGVPAVEPSAGGAGGLVNLNTTTLAQLEALPGVGPVLAQRILDYRDQHGGFRAVSELRNVTGIGDAKYKDLAPRVTV
jgi:competence protein ComEA